LLDLLLEERKINIPSAGYAFNLAQKLNRFIVKDYFDEFKELLMRLDIMDKPEQIDNTDGKGCRLRLNKESKVIGQKGAKIVHIVAQEHGGEYCSSFMRKCNGNRSTTLHTSSYLAFISETKCFLKVRFRLAILSAFCR
jgi:hypothetical protein